MNISWVNVAGIAVVIVAFVLLAIFLLLNRKYPWRGLRAIPTFSRLRQAISLSVEDGSRIHISLGKANLYSQQNASALVGLSVLDRITQVSSISDQPPIATSGDGGLALLSQDTLRSAYRNSNVPDLYSSDGGYLSGATPVAYIAGALPVVKDENVSTNILIGNFGAEVALLADAAQKKNSFLVGGSDALPAQAVLYASTNEPLIGEDLFAAGAYLQVNPSHAASLHAQDFLRWTIVAAILVGSFLKLIGII